MKYQPYSRYFWVGNCAPFMYRTYAVSYPGFPENNGFSPRLRGDKGGCTIRLRGDKGGCTIRLRRIERENQNLRKS